jgi:uncharacterized protein (UPF0335 family)
MSEQEFFQNMVRLLTEAENVRLSVKALQDNGKEAELDVKTLKAAAALYVKDNFSEKRAEATTVFNKYEELTNG